VYQGVYDEHGNPKHIEEEIEMEIPQTEADVARMMDMLRQTSVPV